jgi:hypothetical protein
MAKGSHTTWSPWMPRTCDYCRERITLSGPKARGGGWSFNVERQTARAWHAECRKRERRR